MEQYAKVIRKRMIWLYVALIAMAAAGLYRVFALPSDNIVFDFQCGLVIGLEIMAGMLLVRYRKILKSELLLRQEYNQEQDERKKAIRAKAGVPFVLFTSVGMLLAGTVAGYFNLTVFCTLVGAATVQLLLSCVTKLYYSKTM